MDKIILFCLPYAGASSSVYKKWNRFINDQIEIIPIELNGRGVFYNKPFFNSINEAVENIFDSIKNQLKFVKYAIFGHSMGSILAFELIKKIEKENYNAPIHCFFSGRHPPHIKRDKKYLHNLPDDEFLNEIKKINGTPRDFFENKDLLFIFLPILKADYRMIELYNYNPYNTIFNFDITIFHGKYDEDMTSNDMQEWKIYNNKNFYFHEFESGHFFINDKIQEVTYFINKYLTTP